MQEPFENEERIIQKAKAYIKKAHELSGVDFQIRAVYGLLGKRTTSITQKMQIIHTLMHNEPPFGDTTRDWAGLFKNHLKQDAEIINKKEYVGDNKSRELLTTAFHKAHIKSERKKVEAKKSVPQVKDVPKKRPEKSQMAVPVAEAVAPKPALPRKPLRTPAPDPNSPAYRLAEADKKEIAEFLKPSELVQGSIFQPEEKVVPSKPKERGLQRNQEKFMRDAVLAAGLGINAYLADIQNKGTVRANQLHRLIASSETSLKCLAIVFHAFINNHTSADLKGTKLTKELKESFDAADCSKVIEMVATQYLSDMGLTDPKDQAQFENEILTNLRNGAYDSDEVLTDEMVLTAYGDKKMSEVTLFTPK